jgi:hypothetical protein
MQSPELQVPFGQVLAVLRIVTALLFVEHGTQKLLELPRLRGKLSDAMAVGPLHQGEPRQSAQYLDRTAASHVRHESHEWTGNEEPTESHRDHAEVPRAVCPRSA